MSVVLKFASEPAEELGIILKTRKWRPASRGTAELVGPVLYTLLALRGSFNHLCVFHLLVAESLRSSTHHTSSTDSSEDGL